MEDFIVKPFWYNTDSNISCSHLLSIKFQYTRINAYGNTKAFDMDMFFCFTPESWKFLTQNFSNITNYTQVITTLE